MKFECDIGLQLRRSPDPTANSLCADIEPAAASPVASAFVEKTQIN